MKKLKLTKEDKDKLISEFSVQLNEADVGVDKIEFTKTLNQEAGDKVTIYFTPLAYLKSQALVKEYHGEVGWHGLMEKISDRQYKVYDIMVYPQVVSGARTRDVSADNEWYERYDSVLDKMLFQAHSHVEMSTGASTTDKDNQRDIVRNMINGGFMLFQIWNKKGDINSYFYDIDNNLLYERNDVNIEIIDEDFGTISDFIKDSRKYVQEDIPKGNILNISKEPVMPVSAETYTTGYKWNGPEVQMSQKAKNPFYWNDGFGHEGWN